MRSCAPPCRNFSLQTTKTSATTAGCLPTGEGLMPVIAVLGGQDISHLSIRGHRNGRVTLRSLRPKVPGSWIYIHSRLLKIHCTALLASAVMWPACRPRQQRSALSMCWERNTAWMSIRSARWVHFPPGSGSSPAWSRTARSLRTFRHPSCRRFLLIFTWPSQQLQTSKPTGIRGIEIRGAKENR